MNAVHEVLARRGRPIIVCSAGDEEAHRLAYRAIEVPATVDCLQGVINVVPLQLLAFHLAVLNHHDVLPYSTCSLLSPFHIHPPRINFILFILAGRLPAQPRQVCHRRVGQTRLPFPLALILSSPTRLSCLNPSSSNFFGTFLAAHLPHLNFIPALSLSSANILSSLGVSCVFWRLYMTHRVFHLTSLYPATHLYTEPNFSRIDILFPPARSLQRFTTIIGNFSTRSQ